MGKLIREVGNWVSGDRFWDRENELEDLKELLNEGANIVITGQRRMGKTSLIQETIRRLAKEYLCLYIDLERYDSPADAVAAICVATRPYVNLWDQTKEVFHNLKIAMANNIDTIAIDELTISLRGGLSDTWQEKGERVIDNLAKSEKPVVIFLDEFPLFIARMLKGAEYNLTPERVHTVDIFTSWIRALTIKHKGKLRFVLTGSIGLEPVLRQARLSANLNTFTPFDILPWDDMTSSGCLKALANNYGVLLDDDTIKLILELIGCNIPQHIQMFFSNLYNDCKRRDNQPCSLKDVERIYKTNMLSIRGHAELSTYEERLNMVLGKEKMSLAMEILTETAITGKLTSQSANILGGYSGLEGQKLSDVLREIIGILEHDGYIKKTADDCYIYVSKLVRDWWKARFSFQYIPALKRKG